MTRHACSPRALLAAGAAALLIVVIVSLLAAASSTSGNTAGQVQVVAPWSIHPEAVDRIAHRERIPASSEHPQIHFHAHLSIISEGQVVVVPAGVGFDATARPVALHTHYPDGIIHVECDRRFHPTLGEFMSLWGVQIGRHSLGGRTGDVNVYLDGVRYRGAPSLAPIRDHAQITIVQGQYGGRIPAFYDFGPLP